MVCVCNVYVFVGLATILLVYFVWGFGLSRGCFFGALLLGPQKKNEKKSEKKKICEIAITLQ